MSKIALEFGATIDKYIGDAVLAFFGDPESKGVKEDARSGVRMAIAMPRRVRELQAEWKELGAERPFHSASASIPAIARWGISAARTAWITPLLAAW